MPVDEKKSKTVIKSLLDSVKTPIIQADWFRNQPLIRRSEKKIAIVRMTNYFTETDKAQKAIARKMRETKEHEATIIGDLGM